jgi:hypothetical protein
MHIAVRFLLRRRRAAELLINSSSPASAPRDKINNISDPDTIPFRLPYLSIPQVASRFAIGVKRM